MNNIESPVRADAARNAESIIRAARAVFLEMGPEASLDEVAAQAGVGARTLYRHFPSREHLVKAALDQCIREDVAPKIRSAVSELDPRVGLREVMTAATDMVAREENVIAAARNALVPTARSASVITTALAELLHRGQASGQIRPDVSPGDLFTFLAMLTSVHWGRGVEGSGPSRAIALLLESLRPADTNALPEIEADDCEIPRTSHRS
ncbi:TetR/AcrR family transcriptional regulator [Arthrobacter sp. 2RAF6]|uniref:TetR/AcrR family transcriptional regulator n=1 Tax=Arthrobacter sp. 2RAF6 TaxID=3233002 RepID=UPI003F920E87